MTLVMKFGGSSVGDAPCMQQVGKLVRARLPERPLVVLSAMGKTTNALFEASRKAEEGRLEDALAVRDRIRTHHELSAQQLFDGALPEPLQVSLAALFDELDLLLRGVSFLRELTPRTQDAIASLGERLSTLVFASWLSKSGTSTHLFDAREVLRTNDLHGSAVPNMDALRALAAERLVPLLKSGSAVVTQGYIGRTALGATTTLGRGGSDYSAALLGAAVHAREVQIWTDVEGVLTADPRIVAEAQPIAELSFDEAAELAAAGAKVLHPATIQPAVEVGIPVTVRHTMRPDGHFTTIMGSTRSNRAVTALATRSNVSVITVTTARMLEQAGWLARLFAVFERHNVSVDLVATAEVSVSVTVDAGAPLQRLRKDLEALGTVAINEHRAILSVIGARLRQTAGIAARAFRALETINVEVISMGGNEINLSLVVLESRAAEALKRLHAALIEGKTQ